MQMEQNIAASVLVCVYVLGPLEVYRRDTAGTWEPVARDKWRNSRPARSALKRLLVQPGRRLSREQLADDVWSESGGEYAETNVAHLISLVRGVIGKDLVLTHGTSYEVVGQALVWTDIDAAESLLKIAENQDHKSPVALPGLEQALALLERGAFLEGEYGVWCHVFRKRAEDMLRQAHVWLAENYEMQARLWQAGEQYRAMVHEEPPDEEALRLWLEMLSRHGRGREALKCYQDTKEMWEAQGYTLSAEVEQLAEEYKDTSVVKANVRAAPAFLSRRSFLALGVGAIAGMTGDLTHLWADDLLAIYAQGITACHNLYYSGYPYQVEGLLPLYCKQTATLAQQPSPLQKSAMQLASRAQQLACILLKDREDFGAAEQAGQQAVLYGQLAGDSNLQVASLIHLAKVGFDRKQSDAALRAYEQAVSLFSERVTPLLKGRAYAGLAEVYAMRGQYQETMRAMGLAYECYPVKPEDDPAYLYMRSSRYALYVFGDAQPRLFLGQPKEAERALIALHKETNAPQREPLTKLDLLYHQAEMQMQQGDLEASSATLTEAVPIAKNLGSRLYLNKLVTSYSHLCEQWPQESRVLSLEEAFQPW